MNNTLTISSDEFDFLNSVTAFFDRNAKCRFIERWVGMHIKSKDCSKAASSGDYSTAASSGYCSTAASSGDYSTAASSGDSSKAASSGDSSKAASSGYCSKAASSGYCSKAASSGDYSTAASSGDYSKAASSGDCSKAASSGDYSKAASSGDCSKAASSGDYSKAASSGYCSTAASSGYCSKAECAGKYSACAAVGSRAAVRGELGNLLMCSEYSQNEKGEYRPVGGFVLLVDGNQIKPNCWYICKNGQPTEVDFTDGVFSRVISTRHVGDFTIKRIIIDGQKTQSYLVIRADGIAAHGETIATAKKDLLYKIANRDTSKYKGWKLSDKKTVGELIEAYRVITGACFMGTKAFCESKKLPKNATVEQAIVITRGQYGWSKFAEFFGYKDV